MSWPASSTDHSDDRLAVLLTEIADDFNMPGDVTALSSDGDRHHLVFRPRRGVRVRRIYALASDVAIELGARDLHVESGPDGETLEFQFNDDPLRHWRAMLRRSRQI